MEFRNIIKNDKLIKAIDKAGYKNPTAIQVKAIQPIIEKKDVIAIAETGTGKTAAFAIPLLERLSLETYYKGIKVLVLTPTRELALQIHENFEKYAANLKFKSAVIFGGVKQGSQVKAINNGIDILIATPGRLKDLHEQGYLDFKNLETLVIDEADRMLDMGFIGDVRSIIKLLPKERQTCLFSATLPSEIATLANEILINPEEVFVNKISKTAKNVKQVLMNVDQTSKGKLLTHLINTNKYEQVLVFIKTKHSADRLVKYLAKKEIKANSIHGDKSQSSRQKALQNFKDKEVSVLIATDIAARGIDIDSLPVVINYDIPHVAETYVHRIGRTGRANKDGLAISFCNFEEIEYFEAIEKLIEQKIELDDTHPFKMVNLFKVSKKSSKPTNYKKNTKSHENDNFSNRRFRANKHKKSGSTSTNRSKKGK